MKDLLSYIIFYMIVYISYKLLGFEVAVIGLLAIIAWNSFGGDKEK